MPLTSLLSLGAVGQVVIAQPPQEYHSSLLTILLAAGGVLLLAAVILTPIVLGLRHARRERELEHIERMKALELGRPLPQDAPFWTPQKLCVTMGAIVPLLAFAMAFLATQFLPTHADPRQAEMIWASGAAIGITGLICGTILAMRLVPGLTPDGRKPAYDPDALDVVGRRG